MHVAYELCQDTFGIPLMMHSCFEVIVTSKLALSNKSFNSSRLLSPPLTSTWRSKGWL